MWSDCAELALQILMEIPDTTFQVTESPRCVLGALKTLPDAVAYGDVLTMNHLIGRQSFLGMTAVDQRLRCQYMDIQFKLIDRFCDHLVPGNDRCVRLPDHGEHHPGRHCMFRPKTGIIPI